MLNRLKARLLLAECTGRDIWSIETCQAQGIPEIWIEELADAHESGFADDQQTIYHEGHVTNQYHGVHDLLLARKLAALLDVNVQRAMAMAPGWEAEVRALQEEADE